MRMLLVALSVIAAAATAAGAQNAPGKTERTRDRINKVWDAQLEKMRNRQVEAACKAEAKEHYWAVRFNKRRAYVADCIKQAQGVVVDRAGSTP